MTIDEIKKLYIMYNGNAIYMSRDKSSEVCDELFVNLLEIP